LKSGISKPLESLQNDQYRWYWISMMAQFAAFQMQLLVRGWFVFDLTSSALLVGAVGAAQGLPMLLVAPYAGVIADRINKRNIIIAGQAVALAGTLAIATIIYLDAIKWWHLLLASILHGTAFAIMMPSRQAIVPEIVTKENLLNAISLSSAGGNLARVAAPAIGGLLVAIIGVAGVYYVISILYFISIVLIIPIKPIQSNHSNANGKRQSYTSQILDGWRYIRSNEVVLILLAVGLVTVLFGMPYNMLLPVYTTNILDVGPEVLGTLMSITGIGALIASLSIASLGSFKYKGLLLISCTIFFGIGIMGLGGSTVFWAAAIMMLPIGVGQTSRMALNNTMIMLHSKPEMHGRVMSVLMMEFGVMPLGSMPMAAIADYIGVDKALMVSGAIVVLLGILLGIKPVMRKI
jgi:MFS family permease